MGDQIVLIHMVSVRNCMLCSFLKKSGQFLHLSEKKFENGHHEVNCYNIQTGWNIYHYAPFIPKSEKFVKAGDVVRIYHQEVEGFLKSNLEPLYQKTEYQGKFGP